MVLFVTLLSLCPFDISVGVGAFVIGLSQISSFFSLHKVLVRFSILKFTHVNNMKKFAMLRVETP